MLTLLLLVQLSFAQTIILHPENNACSDVSKYHSAALSSECRYNPDVLSDVLSIAARHGYGAKTYTVTTNEGYILKLYRIKSKSVNVTNSPVLIVHGIAIDAESWVNTANRSLAFTFADKSYDVWVATLRGTINSNLHVNLSINDPEYWNFNLDTQAANDFSDQLDFVVSKTNKKVLVVGHSMGTTLSFMFAAQFSEKADQLIEGIVAFAPVVYLDGVSFTESSVPWGIPLSDLLEELNIKGLFYHENFIHRLEITICKILPETCYTLLSTVSGVTKLFAPDDLLLFWSYWPSGISIYQLKQYLQITVNKTFQKFDYGATGNEKYYGTITPPVYNLTNIQVPVFLFYGENDFLYTEKNLERLYSEIGSAIKYKHAVPFNASGDNPFAHIDFVYSKDIVKDLYNDMFNVLDSYLQLK